MKYDLVKDRIGNYLNRSAWLRKLFYLLLDILLLRTWHVKKAVRQFAAATPDEAFILDAGSGFGQYTWRLARMNSLWKIDAVDIKQDQIDDCSLFFGKAGLSNRVSFSYADLTRFGREDYYHMILSVDVMEHIEEDRLVFTNFHKSLREDGWLIISTPSDKGGSDVHHENEESFIGEHVRDGYSITGIAEKLKEAGFRQVTTRYTYGAPGKISWKLSVKIPVLMLNRSWLFGLILPIWYILVMPFTLLLNLIDTWVEHNEGTALLVIAVK